MSSIGHPLTEAEAASIPEFIDVAVVGGGPAGLAAAEAASSYGAKVVVFEAKPSPGRKFLVAGKGGMNLTHADPPELMARRYTSPSLPPEIWLELLSDYPSEATRAWAESLGQGSFQTASGRVYLKALKSAPLLRRWLAALRAAGIVIATNHRWCGLSHKALWNLQFENSQRYRARAVVFALGGASWPKTGSDGSWLTTFQNLAIPCQPLVPANCGWHHSWPEEIIPTIEGKPLKNLMVSAGEVQIAGELIITRYGLEGGPLYALGPILRQMEHPTIHIDLKPSFTCDALCRKMESVKRDFVTQAGMRWKLPAAVQAIFSRSSWSDIASLAHAVKHWSIPLEKPRPIDEAISSAGGVLWRAIEPTTLMLRSHPGVFVAGEMIDWEAPTGGYLLQGCFATGRRAGSAAARWATRSTSSTKLP